MKKVTEEEAKRIFENKCKHPDQFIRLSPENKLHCYKCNKNI